MYRPVDVYSMWDDVVNARNWTSGLDEVWRANSANQTGIGWQYFATASGVMRYYPGADWPRTDAVDTFDIRRRPSYIVVSG